jgi:hypothetical protein
MPAPHDLRYGNPRRLPYAPSGGADAAAAQEHTMTFESAAWFGGQIVAAALAFALGTWAARRARSVWQSVAIGATALMLLWPLIRLAPHLLLPVVGAPLLVFTEHTGVIMPAVLLFAIAAVHVHPRRAFYLLVVLCGVYLCVHGKWMIAPPVPDLGKSEIRKGLCYQSTSYTCVAAALVTLLQSRGISTSETEMARLSYTGVDIGTTDTRAVLALQRKLRGQPYAVRYSRLSLDQLAALELPCMAPIAWGYFTAHMVVVQAVDGDAVTLADPYQGPRTLSRAAFAEEWLGRAVYLESTHH